MAFCPSTASAGLPAEFNGRALTAQCTLDNGATAARIVTSPDGPIAASSLVLPSTCAVSANFEQSTSTQPPLHVHVPLERSQLPWPEQSLRHGVCDNAGGIVDGDPVGSTVGASDGVKVTTLVGASVLSSAAITSGGSVATVSRAMVVSCSSERGVNVGASVVGTSLGSMVGSAVGRMVGATDGWWVGNSVGQPE